MSPQPSSNFLLTLGHNKNASLQTTAKNVDDIAYLSTCSQTTEKIDAETSEMKVALEPNRRLIWAH